MSIFKNMADIFAKPPHLTASFAARPLYSAARRAGSRVRVSDHGDLINPAAPVHRGDGAGLRSGCHVRLLQNISSPRGMQSVHAGDRLSRSGLEQLVLDFGLTKQAELRRLGSSIVEPTSVYESIRHQMLWRQVNIAGECGGIAVEGDEAGPVPLKGEDGAMALAGPLGHRRPTLEGTTGRALYEKNPSTRLAFARLSGVSPNMNEWPGKCIEEA
ncbi:hypothetical protein GGX14DRAFT_397220 [Mycena pura]|uniref:Uncharacterized protein n=1 Tax=Mycena pura TaxID=153505 RepID=A0AAD6YF12_9AGAR|nr:hypothetical protein GGX14DRAFT_397220 [Mycena pura]